MRERIARRPAVLALLCAVALLVVALAVEVVPRLTRENEALTSTPVPSGRAPATLELQARQTACIDEIAFDREGEVLQLLVDLGEPLPAPPLRVALRAPGYSDVIRVTPAREHALDLPVAAPRRAALGSICVTNEGRRPTRLAATADPRVLQRTRTRIDGGEPVPIAFLASFRRREPTTLLASVGTTVDRVATFNALGPWALWLLLPLIAGGVPFLVLRSFYVAVRDDTDDDRRDA
ncbi:hypothetical protein [Conexibacter woesei]|uniref:Uncharacterized protein n=1 Tax=Conexibacter woesei (strain DSM 14684 / CCUG 47730 / CIP 108061 / JCM 11494 / NBRC 100937 / ID131577) TaxID=469383 RepID=D3EZQ6_CONWI|nr:hypothetical protein [Conexibacter woesei]ADB53894.1 hypothetical protein Cwoe_5489 [Conexibacter woesei DSM 14684]